MSNFVPSAHLDSGSEGEESKTKSKSRDRKIKLKAELGKPNLSFIDLPTIGAKAEADCTKGCKKYFIESAIKFNPKKSLYLKLLKKKEKKKSKEISKIRFKIKKEEKKRMDSLGEICLNMTQINEDRYLRHFYTLGLPERVLGIR